MYAYFAHDVLAIDLFRAMVVNEMGIDPNQVVWKGGEHYKVLSGAALLLVDSEPVLDVQGFYPHSAWYTLVEEVPSEG